MNIAAMPCGHYVCTRLPDGRYAIAPHDDPVAPVIRRLNAARGPRGAAPDDPAGWALVAAWMDEREPLEVTAEVAQLELWTVAELEHLERAA